MQNLITLLSQLPPIETMGNTDIKISGICIDSRQAEQGNIFFALSGTKQDGNQYIPQAIEKGASVIATAKKPMIIDEKMTYLIIPNITEWFGKFCHLYFGKPTEQLKLVGITGTNGKTTVATLLFQLFNALGYTTGLISTVQNQIGAKIIPATHTTPDTLQLNKLLSGMVNAGCKYVFMEVSSHAIHQDRIAGLTFAGAVFTNITHDHLDYHKTFKEYIDVKKSFFDKLPATAFALSNADDKNGKLILQNTKAAKHYYSLRTVADFKGKILENGFSGLVLDIDKQTVAFNLVGKFNAYNLLAAYGVAILLGQKSEPVLSQLSLQKGAEGRFDYQIFSLKNGGQAVGIIDYAHTPDALENVLSTICAMKKKTEKLVTITGCGGNRDKTKRPLMAKIAAQMSDELILTSDNPRDEDPMVIIEEMKAGLNAAELAKTIVVVGRKEAIIKAAQTISPNSILLIAGKGHEKYQEIKGVRQPFDEKEIMINVFKESVLDDSKDKLNLKL